MITPTVSALLAPSTHETHHENTHIRALSTLDAAALSSTFTLAMALDVWSCVILSMFHARTCYCPLQFGHSVLSLPPLLCLYLSRRFACTRHCPAEVERGESCPACCDVPVQEQCDEWSTRHGPARRPRPGHLRPLRPLSSEYCVPQCTGPSFDPLTS